MFTQDFGKIVTTDRIFIPDFDEDFLRYMKVEKGSWYMYGTDLLARATVASGVPNVPYEQDSYDEAKSVCSEDVNLDESLIGEEFGNYIIRTGGSMKVSGYSEDGTYTGDYFSTMDITYFHVIYGYAAGSFSPWGLAGLTDRTDVGIRPMMWVEAN